MFDNSDCMEYIHLLVTHILLADIQEHILHLISHIQVGIHYKLMDLNRWHNYQNNLYIVL